MRIHEFTQQSKRPQQPKTPEQLRIANLQAQKDRASTALAAERQRQKISKAQKSLQTAKQLALPTARKPRNVQ